MRILKVFVFLFLIVFVQYSNAQEFEKIKDVRVKVDSAKKISVVIDVTGPVNYYLFKVSNPARLVAEFTSTELGTAKREIPVKSSFVKKIRLGQFKDTPVKISRLVFDLSGENVYYDAVTIGNTVRIAVANSTAAAKVVIPSVISSSAKKKIKRIARNIPTAAHKKKVEEIKKSQGETVSSESLAEKPAPFKVDKIETEGGFPKISTRKISINFYETDVRMIFKAIAEQTGINIIYGPDVQGTVTLKLKDVSFDDAMRLILKMSGLVVKKEADNIIRVLTPGQLSKERSQATQFTRVLSLKYTRAEDVKKQLSSIKIQGISATISDDPLTNSLIITTSPEGLEKYQELINIFDVKPRQVLIEASMMEVDYNDGLDLGISWGLSNFNVINKGNSKVTGSVQTIQNTVGTLGTPSLTFALGGVINNNKFNATMTMLQKKGKTKKLLNPRIVAMNNEKAEILSGEKVPYSQTTVTTSGSTQSTSFTDVGVKLEVTPTIHSENYVTLEIHPEVSTIREFRPEGPWIVTREATTKVMVKNGEMVVIGGLIKEEDLKSIEQIPILGELPILGYLFKHQQDTNDRVELFIFLKPVILD
ncbi:MAG: AMIN domain-containing protein [Elusimicrobia bacterium]|nr:AMIN domain-containing protein [Elusimicrobiota bacterium]